MVESKFVGNKNGYVDLHSVNCCTGIGQRDARL